MLVTKVYIKTIRGSNVANFQDDGAYKILLSQLNDGDQLFISIDDNITGRLARIEDFEIYSGDPKIPLKFSGFVTNINVATPDDALLGITYFKLEDDGN